MAFRLRRPWFQFSLRTLLALMLINGTVLGPLAARVHRKREERVAVKEVIARGGCTITVYDTRQPVTLAARDD